MLLYIMRTGVSKKLPKHILPVRKSLVIVRDKALSLLSVVVVASRERGTTRRPVELRGGTLTSPSYRILCSIYIYF